MMLIWVKRSCCWVLARVSGVVDVLGVAVWTSTRTMEATFLLVVDGSDSLRVLKALKGVPLIEERLFGGIDVDVGG